MSLPREALKEVNASRSPGAARKILLLIFGVVGSIFIAIAGVTFYNQSQSIEKSSLITAQVIRMEVNSEGLSAPVIEYEWEGKKWLYASSTFSKPPAYQLDEKVPVYVNRENPGEIVVNTFSDRWLLITLFAGLGSVFVAITATVAWLSTHR